MKGVVLAAGKGSRLYPITRHIAKPLLLLANRPTMHYAFDVLKGMGIQDICIVVGENEAEMRSALRDGSDQGVRLSYVKQTEPKGLAHAVGFAQEFVGDDSFVLYLGDAIYDRGFEGFARRFTESGCANLNIVKAVEDPRRFGVANVDGERIVKLVEKPQNPESNLAMAGMYFFGPQIWSILPDLQPSGRGEYEITDAIQMLIDRGETVLAGVYEGEWFDTGTLDSFIETTTFLTKGEPQILGDLKGDKSGTLVIGEGATVECESIENSVVMPGAKVRVTGSIGHSILAGEIDMQGDCERQIVYSDEAIGY